MNDRRHIGYLHHNDGTLSVVGQDGFCWEPRDLEDDETPALDVPTIDVTPESVTDRETGQREIEN